MIVPVPLAKSTGPVLVQVEPLPMTEMIADRRSEIREVVSPATVTSAPFVTLIAPVPE